MFPAAAELKPAREKLRAVERRAEEQVGPEARSTQAAFVFFKHKQKTIFPKQSQ